MADQPTTEFTYSRIQRFLQEGRYDHAIAMLSQRVECQPLDRAARLLLLLANISKFGPGEFNRQLEELRLITDLSGNERFIVQQIFLVGFRHAAQEGQTIQKIVYQCLLRRLMLGQPLDVSISETQVIEEDCSNPSFAEDIPHTLGFSGMNCDDAESEMAPVAPTRIGRGSQPALIGAGAMIVIVLSGFHVATGRKAPWAQNPSRPFALVDSGVQMEIGADRNSPAVILAPTFTDEPARRLVVGQLGVETRPMPAGPKRIPPPVEP